MNDTQVNKINSYQATNLVLTAPANAPLWSPLAAFVRGQTSLAGSINILNALGQSQGNVLTGIAVDKDRLQQSVINRMLIVAGAAGGYAYETGNQTLAAQCATTESKLKNTRDAVLDDLAQALHDTVAPFVTAQPAKLAEYGLTPAMLTDLQSAITAYAAVVGTPRAAIAARAATTTAIDAEIARADANLTSLLDRLMLQFKAAHLDFYNAYLNARKIIDLGSNPGKPAPAEPEPVVPALK